MVYDVIIVGGGPAGLAAAVYAARKRLKTLLVTADIGGQVNLTLRVENYLGYQLIEGAELIDRFHAQVRQYPIDQKVGNKVSRVDRIGRRARGHRWTMASATRRAPLSSPPASAPGR